MLSFLNRLIGCWSPLTPAALPLTAVRRKNFLEKKEAQMCSTLLFFYINYIVFMVADGATMRRAKCRVCHEVL